MAARSGKKLRKSAGAFRQADRSAGKAGHFHLIAKPAGPSCNLRCEYCFYTEKTALFQDRGRCRMPDDVLEAFVKKYIRSHSGDEVEFAWQGGEPTLLGLDFYEKALSLQAIYRGAKRIRNALQTNGTLLDDRWCEFLAKHGFLVGLSLDGPEDVHDRYRRDAGGNGTFQSVMRGLALLRKHGVEFNVLASVTDYAAGRPREVYRFLKEAGAGFIQFQPIVERLPDAAARRLALRLAVPPSPGADEDATAVTPWSVGSEAYGDFLFAVFAEWVRNDVGRTFVMNFEWALGAWVGIPSATCVFAPRCGRCLAVEHNGDVYACDHFVYPSYRLGSIVTGELKSMLESSGQIAFGAAKKDSLPAFCRECVMLRACNGGCPKHRFTPAPDGERGLNYLCKGYLRYFTAIAPYMKAMAQLLSRGEPVTNIMQTQVIVAPKADSRNR